MTRNYKDEITRLYEKVDARKIKSVDALLDKYKGKEEELLAALHKKYGIPLVAAHHEVSALPVEPSLKNEAVSPADDKAQLEVPETQTSPAVVAAKKVSTSYRERLLILYERYAPSRIVEIDSELATHKGREEEFLKSVADEYNAAASEGFLADANSDDYRERLVALYKTYAPTKLHKVDLYLQKYQGREASLLKAVEAKLLEHIRAASEAATTHTDSYGTYKERLQAVYKQHAPRRLNRVDHDLQKYPGREEDVIQAAIKKYALPATPGGDAQAAANLVSFSNTAMDDESRATATATSADGWGNSFVKRNVERAASRENSPAEEGSSSSDEGAAEADSKKRDEKEPPRADTAASPRETATTESRATAGDVRKAESSARASPDARGKEEEEARVRAEEEVTRTRAAEAAARERAEEESRIQAATVEREEAARVQVEQEAREKAAAEARARVKEEEEARRAKAIETEAHAKAAEEAEAAAAAAAARAKTEAEIARAKAEADARATAAEEARARAEEEAARARAELEAVRLAAIEAETRAKAEAEAEAKVEVEAARVKAATDAHARAEAEEKEATVRVDAKTPTTTAEAESAHAKAEAAARVQKKTPRTPRTDATRPTAAAEEDRGAWAAEEEKRIGEANRVKYQFQTVLHDFFRVLGTTLVDGAECLEHSVYTVLWDAAALDPAYMCAGDIVTERQFATAVESFVGDNVALIERASEKMSDFLKQCRDKLVSANKASHLVSHELRFGFWTYRCVRPCVVPNWKRCWATLSDDFVLVLCAPHSTRSQMDLPFERIASCQMEAAVNVLGVPRHYARNGVTVKVTDGPNPLQVLLCPEQTSHAQALVRAYRKWRKLAADLAPSPSPSRGKSVSGGVQDDTQVSVADLAFSKVWCCRSGSSQFFPTHWTFARGVVLHHPSEDERVTYLWDLSTVEEVVRVHCVPIPLPPNLKEVLCFVVRCRGGKTIFCCCETLKIRNRVMTRLQQYLLRRDFVTSTPRLADLPKRIPGKDPCKPSRSTTVRSMNSSMSSCTPTPTRMIHSMKSEVPSPAPRLPLKF